MNQKKKKEKLCMSTIYLTLLKVPNPYHKQSLINYTCNFQYYPRIFICFKKWTIVFHISFQPSDNEIIKTLKILNFITENELLI